MAAANTFRDPFRIALLSLIAFNLCVFLFFALKGLLAQYSYWSDELYSVGTAIEPWRSMAASINSDVHPPTYQIIIWFWTELFGTSEAATRSLSLIFGGASAGLIWLFRKAFPAELLLIFAVFYTSNINWHYYSQETRSYAIVLFLSMLSLAFLARRQYAALLFSSVALGLTHFFGVLLSLIYLSGMFLIGEPEKNIIRRITVLGVAGLIVLAWPVYQILFAGADDHLGGSFWITTSPLMAVASGINLGFPSIQADANAIAGLPLMNMAMAAVLVATILLALGLASARYWLPSLIKEKSPVAVTMMYAAVLFTAMIALVALISIHTPIATPRNFMPVVPIASLLAAGLIFGIWTQGGPWKVGAFIVLGLNTAVSFHVISDRLNAKIYPTENYKSTAKDAYDLSHAENAPVYYLIPESDNVFHWYYRSLEFYMPEKNIAEVIPIEEIVDIPRPAIVIYAHEECAETNQSRLSEFLKSKSVQFNEYLPIQAWDCHNGFAYLPASTTQLKP